MSILTTARKWLAQDPDSETRAELEALILATEQGDTQAEQTLHKRFAGRLQFGTAGLRGTLQAGSMGMNRVLVAQAAGGLAQYLQQYDQAPSIVIGYDGRKNSAIFAKDTAEIMAGAGIKTYLLPRALPTPVLAYAIRHLDTSAGVMVTASHNPPQDNGYKVYLGKANGGGQIVSPADKEIAACIEQVAQSAITELPRSSAYEVLAEDIINAYIERTAQVRQASQGSCELNYVYTAMHGVGKEVFLKTLSAAKLPLPHLVTEQIEPDSAFPTVAFPNPEEKGALDLAIALAKAKNAQFILANDPDADRLAVAIADKTGHWQSLHGNMIGWFLAVHIARLAQRSGKKGTLACSLVSSPALGEIAKHFGFAHQETLTGFKYISKVENLLYGYEEALGYLVDPDKVRDKDGISAAIAFLDFVCALQAEGKTLQDFIQEFEQTFGAYASGQISIRMKELNEIPKLMQALRQHPPTHIGKERITRSQDYLQHAEANDILIYYLENDSRLIVRPSGTEPKVKFYLDVKGNTAENASELLKRLDKDTRELLRQAQYGAQEC